MAQYLEAQSMIETSDEDPLAECQTAHSVLQEKAETHTKADTVNW